MPQKMPDVVYRPANRLQGTFAPGTVLTNGTPIKQIITLANCIGYAIRILTVTSTGTLAVTYLDPSARTESGVIITGVGSNAAYATGAPASVAVSAATEAILIGSSYPYYNGTTAVLPTYNGESYALITFTPTLTGSLAWCDLCQIQPSV